MSEHETEIDEAEAGAAPRRLPGGLDYWAVRLLYAVLAGLVVNVTTGIYALGNVVAVVLFVLMTVIVVALRRR